MREYLDVDGFELAVGDSVVLATDYYRVYRVEPGVTATIAVFNGDAQGVGLDFGEGSGRGNHSLGRILPHDNGLWVYSDGVRKVDPPATSFTTDDADAPYLKQLSKLGQAIMQGEEVYALASTPTNLSTWLAQRDQKATQVIKAAHEDFRIQIEKLKVTNANQLMMPAVTLEDAQRGLRLWKDNTYIAYATPLTYEPQIIAEGRQFFRISPEDQAALKCVPYFLLLVDIKQTICTWSFRTPDLSDYFYHYHDTCLGNLHLPKITCPQDVWAFCNVVANALKTINADSLANRRPLRMLSYVELKERATPIKQAEAGVWSTNRGSLRIGRLVRVIDRGEDLPASFVGIVGKIVATEEFIGDLYYGVEFAFVSEYFNTINGFTTGRRGFWFRESEIELAPNTTRTTQTPGGG